MGQIRPANQFSLALWSPQEYIEIYRKSSESGVYLALEHIFSNFLWPSMKYSWEPCLHSYFLAQKNIILYAKKILLQWWSLIKIFWFWRCRSTVFIYILLKTHVSVDSLNRKKCIVWRLALNLNMQYRIHTRQNIEKLWRFQEGQLQGSQLFKDLNHSMHDDWIWILETLAQVARHR